MCCTAETSAATASQASAQNHSHSAKSPDRRTNNSATAANRCAIAVDSSRVASPITSMRSTSDVYSNMKTAYLLRWTYAGQVTFVAVGPVGGVDYPRTYQEFRAWFPDDAPCADYLAHLRWPEGFRCPVCGGDKAWQTSTQHWKCAECGRKTSVTAGTIFHRSRTPMSTWFAAVWFLTSQKNGISALALQQQLGFGSYETAWAWLHKLRRAMVRPDRDRLSGVVELDEIFVGGVATGRAGAST